MAAAQHRLQKPNMFRRILSPRDRTKQAPVKQDKALRTSSMSDMNSHRRDIQLQGSIEVENTEYRDPEQMHQQYPPAPPASSAYRSQSMICSPVDGSNPPLPPRNNRPISFSTGSHPLALQRKQSNDPEESSLYMEPANTLKNTASIKNAASMSNYVQVEPSEALPTRKDLKKMTLYRETMEQSIEQKSGGGHRRVRSFGHVIDNSEYSTPFDLLKQNNQAKLKGEAVLPESVQTYLYNQPIRSASDRPPPKPKTTRRIHQTEPTPADTDVCIPVISPTPPGLSNRSHTNSPSSPHSTHSSEQELIRDDGTNDYDEPWDSKFKNLTRMRSNTTKSDSQVHHDHLNDRASPPSPGSFERPQRPYRERDPISISPELLIDRPLAFVKGGLERSSGRREGSPSPLPPTRDGRSVSSAQAPFNASHHRFDHGDRTSFVSMSKRVLPPTPTADRNDRRILTREGSPPPTIIDISIPLQDQP